MKENDIFFSDIFDTHLPHVGRFLPLHIYLGQIQGTLFSLRKVSWILLRDMTYLDFIKNEKTLLAKFLSDQTRVC
jgi:hypothetical protein